MRVIASLLLILIAAAAFNEIGWACTCSGPPDPSTAYRSAKAVFLGTAVERSPQTRMEEGYLVSGKNAGKRQVFEVEGYSFTFEIEEAFKGIKGKSVKIHTDAGGGSCGYPFGVGKEYLVYAYGASEDSLGTGICSRTRPASNAQDELGMLRSMKDGVSETRIFGVIVKMEMNLNGAYGNAKYDTPMSGIKVTAEGASGKFESFTDSTGHFSFVGLPAGEYEVIADVPRAYKARTGFRRKIEITDSERGAELSFIFQLNAPISGTVYDEDGRPVGSQFEVAIAKVDEDKALISGAKSNIAFTDESSRYSFDSLPPGKYVIGVNIFKAPPKHTPYPLMYYPKTQDIAGASVLECREGDQLTIDLHLLPRLKERVISGIVLSEDGPAPKVQVYLSDVKEPGRSIFGLEAETDALGQFTIKCFAGQEYLISGFKVEEGSEWRIEPVKAPPPEASGSITLTLLKKERAQDQQKW
jgi:hypothetical protein